MRITSHSLNFIQKIGLPWTSFVVGEIKHPDSKKITGMLHTKVPVLDVNRDGDDWLVRVGSEEQARIYRTSENPEIEIFLYDIPPNLFTLKPFDESNRAYDTNAGELDRVKRLLATGLAIRNHNSFVGWMIEAAETDADGNTEVLMVFESEGDALMAGSLFHEILGDKNTDFTSILPTKESPVPWLSDADNQELAEQEKKKSESKSA